VQLLDIELTCSPPYILRRSHPAFVRRGLQRNG
jgi:hypothetical protein